MPRLISDVQVFQVLSRQPQPPQRRGPTLRHLPGGRLGSYARLLFSQGRRARCFGHAEDTTGIGQPQRNVTQPDVDGFEKDKAGLRTCAYNGAR